VGANNIMKIFSNIKKLFIKIIYGNDYELLYNPNRRDQSMLTAEAVVGGVGLALISGSFRDGFLIQLNASDKILSFVAVIGAVAGLSAVFAGAFFDNRLKRKKIIVSMLLIARLGFASTVYIPLVIPKENPYCVLVIVCILFVCSVIQSIGNIGYNIWLAAVVPANIRGRFIAVRTTITQLILPFVPLVVAVFLDSMKAKNIAFMILGALTAILVSIEAYIMSRVNEADYSEAVREKSHFGQFLLSIKDHTAFIGFVVGQFFYSVCLYISASFINTYLLKYNKFSYTLISLVGALNIFIMIFLYKKWGRYCDKVGAKKMMNIGQMIITFQLLSFALIPIDLLKPLVFLPYMFAAIANSGYGIAVFVHQFEIYPEKNRNFFSGSYTAMMAIAVLIAPMIGNKIKEFIESVASESMLENFWQFRILFLLSAVLIWLQKIIVFLFGRRKQKNHN